MFRVVEPSARTMNRVLPEEDAAWLQDNAERLCRFFRDWSSHSTNWLIPDSVWEDGEAVLRLSPPTWRCS